MNRIAQYFPDDEQFAVDDCDDGLFDFDGRDRDQEVRFQTNYLRHFDPTPGRWLDESPVGCAGGEANVTRYVPE